MDYDELIQDNCGNANGKEIYYHPKTLVRYQREVRNVPVLFYVYVYGRIVCQYTGSLLDPFQKENNKSVFYNIKIHKAELFVEGQTKCLNVQHPLNAEMCEGVHVGRDLQVLDFKLIDGEYWIDLELGQFPSEILAHIPSISDEKFVIKLNNPQLLDPTINRLRHFIDNNNIQGQFTSYCQGYFRKEEKEQEFEYLPIVEQWSYTGNYEYGGIDNEKIRFEQQYSNCHVFPNIRWTDWLDVHEDKNALNPIWVNTGEVEWNKCAFREERKNINPLYTGQQFSWGDWTPDPEKQFEGEWILTGQTRCREGYVEEEYKNSNVCYKPSTKWVKTAQRCQEKPPGSIDKIFDGCFSTFKWIAFSLLVILCLVGIIFRLPILIPFGILWLLTLIPSKLWRWLLNALGLLFLLVLIFNIVSYMVRSNNQGQGLSIPKPMPIPPPVKTPMIDTTRTRDSALLSKDSIIMHHLIWNDYDGTEYDCWLKVRKSDSISSSNYKRVLKPEGYNAETNYAQMLSALSQHDNVGLGLIYQSLDSIKKANKISELNFPKVIVSMVQRIPYVLVLQTNCDEGSMGISSDENSQNISCDGNQPFGINAPIEFLSNMKGDCDTRTLLLFTILSHYGYDVAIFSSDIYQHSILGINLPYSGTRYNVNDKNYVLWETTSMGFEPGALNPNIGLLNYWYLSIRNK